MSARKGTSKRSDWTVYLGRELTPDDLGEDRYGLTLGVSCGRPFAAFEVETPQDLCVVVGYLVAYGGEPLRIEPDDLVTASEIARRSGLSREAIRLYWTGKRKLDVAAFPQPIANVETASPLWSWCAVSRWLYAFGRVSVEVVLFADAVAEINVLLAQPEVRRFGRLVAKGLRPAPGRPRPAEPRRARRRTRR